jgi:hypothetical protein
MCVRQCYGTSSCFLQARASHRSHAQLLLVLLLLLLLLLLPVLRPLDTDMP